MARTRDFRLIEPFAARNSQLAGPALALLLDMSINRVAKDGTGWLNEGAAKVIPDLVESYPEATSSPEVASVIRSKTAAPDDAFISKFAITLSFLGRANASALPASFVEALQARVRNPRLRPAFVPSQQSHWRIWEFQTLGYAIARSSA